MCFISFKLQKYNNYVKSRKRKVKKYRNKE